MRPTPSQMLTLVDSCRPAPGSHQSLCPHPQGHHCASRDSLESLLDCRSAQRSNRQFFGHITQELVLFPLSGHIIRWFLMPARRFCFRDTAESACPVQCCHALSLYISKYRRVCQGVKRGNKRKEVCTGKRRDIPEVEMKEHIIADMRK